MNPRIHLLQEYFTQNELSVDNYIFSCLMDLGDLFEKLISNGIIKEGQSFVDLGSGDGRVVALANLLGFNASGIELNDQLYKHSIKLLSSLKEKKIIGNFSIQKADFTQVELEYDIVFNFLTLPDEIKVKKGSLLLLYSLFPYEFDSSGFEEIVQFGNLRVLKRIV